MNTARHLRRIRIRLTIVYALMMSIALLVLAVLAVNTDRRVRESEMNEAMLAAAQSGAGALAFDEAGEIVLTSFASEDDIADAYPQLHLFVPDAAGAEPNVERIAAPVDEYWPEADFGWYAASVLYDNADWLSYTWSGAEDADVVVRGVRVAGAGDESQRVAVVAVANPLDWLDGNGSFRDRVVIITIALILASTAAGYVIAGRTIRPTAEALEQQERLISDAAHELRTPVARIRAAAEGGLAGDETPDAALGRVATVATDAGVAIDDLLTLARMDAGRQRVDKESLRLDLLAEQVAATYEDVDVETVSTIIRGDPGLLRRAIDNLVRNAVQHGRAVDPDAPVVVTVYPTMVVVGDGGPGIDPEVRPHLFDRFRSRAGSEGHGLGMAIVAWITGAHGGTADVRRSPLGGAEIRLVFPAGR